MVVSEGYRISSPWRRSGTSILLAAPRTNSTVGLPSAAAPLAVRGSRMAVRKGLMLPIYEAELLAENYRMKVALTKGRQLGARAFLDKRPPKWRAE